MSNVKIFKQQTNKQAKQDRKSETQKNSCPRLSYMRISKKNNHKPGKEKIRSQAVIGWENISTTNMEAKKNTQLITNIRIRTCVQAARQETLGEGGGRRH